MTTSNSKLIGLFPMMVCILMSQMPAYADSTSPRLAAYYEQKMLLCDQTAYQWSGNNRPTLIADNIAQVGIGRDTHYLLTTSGELLAGSAEGNDMQEVLDNVTWFVAGKTGVFAARSNGSVEYAARPKRGFGDSEVAYSEQIGTSVKAASIGDSADYFVNSNGILFVKGLAHRGQYGDGKLESSKEFIPVASNVVAIKAHTGHAILLKQDGTVMGTGGNIYGPLGRHGIGDKALVWGEIFRDAVAIATGSSHSLAIRQDGTLWHWGRGIGLDPEKILDDVTAAAADRSGSIALLHDNSLWQWKRGQQPMQHFQCP